MTYMENGFDYKDVEWIVNMRRSLGLRSDHDFVCQLVDGTIPSIKALEFGLLTHEEYAETQLALRLQEDAEVIREYARNFADSWAGLRFNREGIVAVLVASFTSDLDTHHSRLLPLVPHPDRLRLQQARWSLQHLIRVRDEILSERPTGLTGIGIGSGVVNVSSGPETESTARHLRMRYGDQIKITTGVSAYAL